MICYICRGGKIWICVFLDKLVIMRAVEICMGFGKGVFEYWVVVVKLGCIMFELGGVVEEIVCEVMCLVLFKLLIKIRFIVCEED